MPERALADAFTAPVVIASVEVPTDQMSTFSAFTDAGVYSRWLGVPVRIDDGDFSCTLEWGTEVRGRYELVAAPRLLVMRWDFDDGKEPEPGSELTAYLQVFPVPAGSRVEVHQLVDTAQQAEFMEGAWTLVLGRLKAGIVEALDARADVAGRQPRAKRRPT